MDNDISRRRFIREVSVCSSGLIISQWLPVTSLVSASEKIPSSAEKMVIAHGPSPDKIVTAAVEAMGGMTRFVSKGDIVALKPNIGWDRTPEQGATTHPDVVSALVRLCLNAGAKEVRVLDNTCNEAKRCYKRSGIEASARAAGAKVLYYDERKDKMMKIGGQKVVEWPVNLDLYEVDCLINVPVAKHHGMSRLTMGMKNWFGAVGGRRNKLHQDIDQTIVDLSLFFKPKLVVLDAFRILTRNGPQGGNTSDVKYPRIVAISTDQVAIDAFGGTLFDLKFDELEYVRVAEQKGLGVMDYSSLTPRELKIS
ncbi:DUF362 domain-containing protein [bacterium]|nr:DUF362 domain-containing protein [bacterium]